MPTHEFFGTLWLDGSDYSTRHNFNATDYWVRNQDGLLARVRVWEAEPATHAHDVENFARRRHNGDWAVEDWEGVR